VLDLVKKKPTTCDTSYFCSIGSVVQQNQMPPSSDSCYQWSVIVVGECFFVIGLDCFPAAVYILDPNN